MLYEGYKYYRICEGKEGKVFWQCEFHKAGCKGRATPVSEAIDITCNEHNHPPDQASNKAEKLVSSMRKRAREETVSIH